MIVTCPNCEEQFNVDETKLPPRRVKSKCIKCGDWMYLRRDDGDIPPPAPDLDRGLELLKDGDMGEAKEFYQEALETHDSPEIRKEILQHFLMEGSELASRQEADRAMSTVKLGLELFSKEPQLWGMLGDILSDKKNTDKAKDAFKKALKLDPLDASYYIGLANIHKELRRPDEESKVYKKAVKALPKNSLLYLKYAQALLNWGEAANCLKAIQTAVKLDKRNKAAVRFMQKADAVKAYIKAVEMFKKKKFKEANPLFDAAQKKLSSFPLLYYYHGVCQYMLRKFNEAVISLEKHLHLDAHGLKTEKAISFLQRAIKELHKKDIKVLLQPIDQCHLIVESEPEEATVYMDDEMVGTAPLDLASYPAGQHFLKVTNGSDTVEAPVILSGGISYKIKVELEDNDFQMAPSLDYELG